jgi:hypothetical protein
MWFGVPMDQETQVKLYCHVSQWLKTGFGLVIGFTNHLQVVTTINYYTIADLHILQSLHTNLLGIFPLVFTLRFLTLGLQHRNYKRLTESYYSNITVLLHT